MTNNGAEQTEPLFRSLLEAAPDGIVIAEHDGTIRFVNRQTEVLFGYQRGELLGNSVEMLLPERFRPDHVVHRAGYVRAPHTRPMGQGRELYGRRKDGAEFPVEISLSPISTDGETLVISVVRDITANVQVSQALRRARDEAEAARTEAERANHAKSEFLSRMSHELRTPLNAVLGFAQLLEMDPLTPTQHGNVKRILKGGRHLLDLINEVLDIARIETGRLQLSPEPVRLADALREAIDLIRPLAVEQDIRLHEEALDGCQVFVSADRQRLKQVLLNLLANAIKYNRPEGSVRVGCRLVDAGAVQIDVADTGHGIPAEKLDRLFSPFDRLGAEMGEVEGTGLGLALSRGLVEAMGGTIVVETGHAGSVFSVRLRVTESQIERHDRLMAREHPGVALPAEGAVHTVLYIEDNLPNLELIEQIFARHRTVRLISAMQGRLGIELAAQHEPSLVLLDLHLPDISGLEVLRQFQDDPRIRDVPVVVISADATAGQIERLLAAGARAYLTKPLDVPAFVRLVSELLEEADPV